MTPVADASAEKTAQPQADQISEAASEPISLSNLPQMQPQVEAPPVPVPEQEEEKKGEGEPGEEDFKEIF